MAYRYLYHGKNGAYLQVRIIFKGSIYYDPFALKVHMNDQVFNPDEFPDELADTLSWGDFLDLQFFKLNARLEERRREEEIERRRIEALTLRENIISLSDFMSKIYHRRELM